MMKLKVSEIAIQKMLNGNIDIEHDMYNNKHYLLYSNLQIRCHEDGFIVAFMDKNGAELLATEKRVGFDDTITLHGLSGRVEVEIESG